MDNLDQFFVYDDMLHEPLMAKGWLVDQVPWRSSGVDWQQYKVVVIRSTWDYQDDPQAFMQVLEAIDASNAILANPLPLMQWNISKDYLKDLEAEGVPIVSTLWQQNFDLAECTSAFDRFGADEIIIKPLVSANADFTYRLTREALERQQEELAQVFTDKPHMIQPFEKAIIEEGEYSLFYFGGAFSHAILKVPKAEDFRVQEEHGGQLHSVKPKAPLLALGEKTLAALPSKPLYARLDFVHTPKGFAVMEIELIEPSLYFNMDPQSPQRFVDAFVQAYGEDKAP